MPRARSQRKGGKGTGSRHHAGRLTSPAELTSGATRRLGMLKASDGGEAGGSCFLGDSAGLAGGILKSHSQEREQRLRNCKNEVLTHLWRSTSYASTVGRCARCHSKTLSSCGGGRNLCGTGPGTRRAGRREAQMKKRSGSQPQGRQPGRSDQAPLPDDLPRPWGLQPRESQVASPHQQPPRGG